MNKKDLQKLVRLSEVVRSLYSDVLKIEGSDLRGFVEPFKSYREQINHIVLRNVDYQLEFQAVPRETNYATVKSAYSLLKSFLDSVVKEETIKTEPNQEQLKSEFFIDQNQPFTAHSIITDLIKNAVTDLKIIDNYLDSSTLEFFHNINTRVNIKILTKVLKPSKSVFDIALKKFQQEWGGKNIEIKETDSSHDRFLIVDDSKIWVVGPSLNRIGLKAAVIVELSDEKVKDSILKLFLDEWIKT